MDKYKILFKKCLSNNLEDSNESIKLLGLLLEKHFQKRDRLEYAVFFEKNSNLLKEKITKDDIDYIVYFLFYLLFNYKTKALSASWSLGKCYGLNSIQQGLINAFSIYSKVNDDISLQIAMSVNQLYELEGLKKLQMLLVENDFSLKKTRKFYNDLTGGH